MLSSVDVLILNTLNKASGPTHAHRLKAAVGRLPSLVSKGFIKKSTVGMSIAYIITPKGETALRSHNQANKNIIKANKANVGIL